MDAKQRVELDLIDLRKTVQQLRIDLEMLHDEERAEMKEKISQALGEYADEIEKIKDLDRTLIQKLGKRGRTFLYICIGILAIAGVDKLVSYIKMLF